MSSNTINSVGLVLDVVGALMLWRFVVQSPIKETENKKGWVLSAKTLEEAFAVSARNGKLSQLGIIMIILGFLLQLLSNMVAS